MHTLPEPPLGPHRSTSLVEIIANLRDRIKLNGWLGEVTGLDASLQAAARKLVSLDRMRDRLPLGAIDFGITPVITDTR